MEDVGRRQQWETLSARHVEEVRMNPKRSECSLNEGQAVSACACACACVRAYLPC